MQGLSGMGGSKDSITSDDLSRVNKAMKDPKFKDFMQDYWDEMTAEGNREEYDQYLEQLEAKDELQPGTELLRAKPGCCIRTTMRFRNGCSQKLFLNICQSNLMEDLTITEDKQLGGHQVNMPYSQGPPRPDKTEKKKENCMTADFAVGVGTFKEMEKRPQILKMIVDTATAALQQQFFKDHEEVMKDFTVLKNMKCKGDTPYLMSVQTSMLKKDKKRHRKSKKEREKAKEGITPGELRTMKKELDDKRKAEETESEKDESEEEIEEEEPDRVRVPVHKLIHQGIMDMGNFMESINGPMMDYAMRKREIPENLKLVIQLPTVKAASEIDIEVTDDAVVVEVGNKFYLDLPLPYKIDSERGSCKFEKMAKPPTITFTLPVCVSEQNLRLHQNEEILAENAAHHGDDLECVEDELPELKDPEPEKKEETAPETEHCEDNDCPCDDENDPDFADLPPLEDPPMATTSDGQSSQNVLDLKRSDWMDMGTSLDGNIESTDVATSLDSMSEIRTRPQTDDTSCTDIEPEEVKVEIIDSIDEDAADITPIEIEQESEPRPLPRNVIEESFTGAYQIGETRDSIMWVFKTPLISDVIVTLFEDYQFECRMICPSLEEENTDRAYTMQAVLRRGLVSQWHWEYKKEKQELWVIIRKVDAEHWCGSLLTDGPQIFEHPRHLEDDISEVNEEITPADEKENMPIELPKGSDATMGQGVLLRNRVYFELF